ncbi:uncharacterized protein LOC123523631 [Mercenaria mercenaria]|uniref:uncharacterized protein LOC123523631 n=1 Tax=Mercenaria mercenaria TaxID=6596 RepID=UPI00234EFC6B|nr:uncharacterized protein LOC123523631 [Mercenaria mercenaria]
MRILTALVICSIWRISTTNGTNQISQLLSRVENVENAVRKRNVVIEEQENRIRRLQLELQKERTQRLDTQAKLENRINQLTQRNDKLERCIDDQDGHIERLINQYQSQYADREKRKRFLTNGLETTAFHATLDHYTGLQHVRVGSTIPFPDVKLNIGGGYQNTSSVFVAPQAGVYVFSTSIMSFWNPNGELHAGIMKNGVYQAGAYVNDIGGPPEQGSVTISMLLGVGDRVWVQHVVHDDGTLYGDGLSSFMGCLIFTA